MLRLRQTPVPSSFKQYRDDPVGFAREVLGEELWAKEAEILEAVRDRPMVAVVKANAVGGTFTAASAALWWLNCFQPSKVISTAPPPERQIRDLLWGEIRAKQTRSLHKGLVGGNPRTLIIKVNDEWWAQGFTIPLSGTREERIARFQGHHSPHLLFIFDEAHGIPDEIWEAADSCLSGGHWRFLILSNPLAPSGPFHGKVRAGGWHVIHISALEHPNVVAGQDVIPGCVSQDKTVERIQRWSEPLREDEIPDAECFQTPGFLDQVRVLEEKPVLVGDAWRRVTNSLLSVKTLGQFPSIGGGLIPLAWVQKANELWSATTDKTIGSLVLGVDPARFGESNTGIAWRYGNVVERVEKLAKQDTMAVAGYVKAVLFRDGAETPTGLAKVEVAGLGAGVVDRLREQQAPLVAVNVAGGIGLTDRSGELKFANVRAYIWYALREALEAGELALPPNDELTEELTAVRPGGYTSAGKFKLESKDALKRRIGRSPDLGDAVALTFAPVIEAAYLPEARAQPRIPSKWAGRGRYTVGRRWGKKR